MTITATAQPIFSPRPKPRLLKPIPAPEIAGDCTQSAARAPAAATIFSDRPAPVLTRPIPDLPVAPDLPQVVSIGTLIKGGRWRTEAMRAYSRPVLYWFTRGQGRVTIAGRTRGFVPHSAFLLPSGVMHGFDLFGQVTGNLVFFPRSLSDDMPDAPWRMSFRDGQSQMELTALIDALRVAGEMTDDMAETAMGHHAGLLSIWLRRAGGEPADVPSRDLVPAFTRMIEADYGRGLTVADYAARLGVTPTHLTRVCRAAGGRSAHALLSSRRLYEAQRLLADGNETVARIAECAGFGSAAYFARAFRKATGQSPSDFRRSAPRIGSIPT